MDTIERDFKSQGPFLKKKKKLTDQIDYGIDCLVIIIYYVQKNRYDDATWWKI